MGLPKIKLGKYNISRMILGGNPISGFSHLSPKKDMEMVDYHTTKNIKSLLSVCEENGINTIQARGDRHIMRILNEYWAEGGKIQWIAQIASELKDMNANVKQIVSNNAMAIFHHGTYTDNLWHRGLEGIIEVWENLKTMRETGLQIGLGTHRPGVIEYAEKNNWDVDFYMASFYNLAKKVKGVQATEGFKEELFDDNDREKMIKTINQTSKPCFGFKILGAGRKTNSEKELKEAFRYAFDNIKSNDAVIVGMCQKYKNQVKQNSEIVWDILRKQIK